MPGLGAMPVLANALPASQLIPLDKFDDERRKRIAELAATVQITDSISIMTFGTEPQRRMNAFLDEMLKGVRTDETGAAGELIMELSTTIKGLNLPKMKEEVAGEEGIAGMLAKLPLVGAHFSALRHFQESRKEIHEHLDRIEKKASVEMGRLQAENAAADARARETLINLRELEVHLAAGQVALLKARDEFASLKSKVEASHPPDPVQFSGLRDMAEQINAFETRLLRMNIAIADGMVWPSRKSAPRKRRRGSRSATSWMPCCSTCRGSRAPCCRLRPSTRSTRRQPRPKRGGGSRERSGRWAPTPSTRPTPMRN
jgi:hypothetical protein